MSPDRDNTPVVHAPLGRLADPSATDPDPQAGALRGGRAAAEAALAAIDPVRYARTRNFLDGAVTQLSPFLRHGVLSLAEVRDHALARVNRAEDAEKLINELAWRDYWQRVYRAIGNGVWTDREPYKTGFAASSYAEELPAALTSATTGLACMDSFSRQLRASGYLHNHARMWMAAYVVHWLRVRWQAGARWFLSHLLDGDPASNNLSWQWVAGTFSFKPYFFTRENLERYTHGVYCRSCPLSRDCPLAGGYADLQQRLFPNGMVAVAGGRLAEDERGAETQTPSSRQHALSRPLVWIHTDSLNPKHALLLKHPHAAACFVWDEEWLREEEISSKRIAFADQCLAEFPGSLDRRRGDVSTEILAAASGHGADHVVAQRTPDPRLLAAGQRIGRSLPMVWVDSPAFADDRIRYDLKRFSRYWQRARSSALRPTQV